MKVLLLINVLFTAFAVQAATVLADNQIEFIGCHWPLGQEMELSHADEDGNLYFMDSTGYKHIEFMNFSYTRGGLPEEFTSEFMQHRLTQSVVSGPFRVKFYELTEQLPEDATEQVSVSVIVEPLAADRHILFFNLTTEELKPLIADCVDINLLEK